MQGAANVPAIARCLGIEGVVVDPQLDVAGRLEICDGPTIYVSGDLGNGASLSTRQTFTVAHELGHYLLHAVEGHAPEKQVNSPAVEAYCDRFASALLMPRDWLRREYADVPPHYDVVEQLRARCSVSRAAAVRALNDGAGWSAALFRWSRQRSRWRLTDVVVPTGASSVNSGDRTNDYLERLGSGSIDESRFPLRVCDRDVLIRAQVFRGGEFTRVFVPVWPKIRL